MLKAQTGDLNKMGLLFERYKKVLLGFFINMCKDKDLSEDLVQNVFVRIIKYRKSFRGEGQFKVWMFHIARNVLTDHFRKNKIGKTDDLETWGDRLGDDSDVSADMIKNDELEILRKAMDYLDKEKKEVLVLSKIEELKYKEIADILDCSEGAVKVKVFRAMKELKETFVKIHEKV